MKGVDLLHKDLSYKLTGIFYTVHNKLGPYRNEKQYGDLIKLKLIQNNISFEREKLLDISFEGENRGRNRIDFIIENIIILEIKTKPVLSKNDYWQIKRYLNSSNLELGLLVNFSPKYCIVKRVLNINKF